MSSDYPRLQQMQLTPLRAAANAQVNATVTHESTNNQNSRIDLNSIPPVALQASTNRVINSNITGKSAHGKKLSLLAALKLRQKRLQSLSARQSSTSLTKCAVASSSEACPKSTPASTSEQTPAGPQDTESPSSGNQSTAYAESECSPAAQKTQQDSPASGSGISSLVPNPASSEGASASPKELFTSLNQSSAEVSSSISSGPTPKASGSRIISGTMKPSSDTRAAIETAPAFRVEHLGTEESTGEKAPLGESYEPAATSRRAWKPSSIDNRQTADLIDLPPSTMADMAATPRASHRRQKRMPQIQKISHTEEQPPVRPGKPHQTEEDRYQTIAEKQVTLTRTKTPKEERTFQQQYMEQQAQLDRQSLQKGRRRRTGSDDEKDPQAKLVGAAAVMSTGITFAMTKFQELLQARAGTNSRLVYAATSESFTSSLAATGEEKKDTAGDRYSDEEEERHHPRSSSSSRRRRRRLRNKLKNKRDSGRISMSPSAVSATSSVLSTVSSGVACIGPTNQAFVEEISPMIRMRNPEAQHAVELAASSSDQGANSIHTTQEGKARKPSPADASDEQLQSASTFKTEEQVKAEKQRKWKKKMKIAEQQRQQEKDELGDDIYQRGVARSSSTSIDEEDEDFVDDVDDDVSDVSFVCRPGSDFVEIWTSISGISVDRSMVTNRKKAVTKNPVEVFQKIVSVRCGLELTEVSSSEGDEEEEGQEFSFTSDEDDEDHHGKAKPKHRRILAAVEDEDEDEDESQEGKLRGRIGKNRGGQRLRRRSKSPNSQSSRKRETSITKGTNRTRGHSVQSQSSRTSRHSEASLGDMLGRREEDRQIVSEVTGDQDDRRSEPDRLELHLLRQKPNFHVFGNHSKSKSGDTTVISGGSSTTPVAGPSSSVSFGESIFSEDWALPQIDATTALHPAGIEFSESLSNVKKGSSLKSVKLMSFDENPIPKQKGEIGVPTANLDRSDPNFIRNLVSALSHHGTPVLWHRTPAVVEKVRGSNSSIVRAASETETQSVMAFFKLQATGRSSDRAPTGALGLKTSRQFSGRCDSPQLLLYRKTVPPTGINQDLVGHIDLFDIANIEIVATMSPCFLQTLEEYPYSMPSRTLVVHLNVPSSSASSNYPSQLQTSAPAKMIVLEATSDDSATALVLGIKQMVAQLAFSLIVGSIPISCELLLSEQNLLTPEERASSDEDSMTPTFRGPIVRRTQVINDITFHMLAKVHEQKDCLHQPRLSRASHPPNEFGKDVNIVPYSKKEPPGFVASAK